MVFGNGRKLDPDVAAFASAEKTLSVHHREDAAVDAGSLNDDDRSVKHLGSGSLVSHPKLMVLLR